MRNGGLSPTLGYDSQIFQVFQQFFVVRDWKNDGCALAVIIRDVLNSIAHGQRLLEKEPTRNDNTGKI